MEEKEDNLLDKFSEKFSENKNIVIGLLGVIILFVLLGVFLQMEDITPEEEYISNVTLTTEDGWQINATHFDGGERGVVMMHMLGQDEGRMVWNETAHELKEEGFSVMTIDLRGHAESQFREGEEEKTYWRDFEDDYGEEDWETEFKKMRLDLKAAVEYLEEESEIESLGVVGAELSSNVAAYYTDIGDPNSLVLLSPGTGPTYHRGVPINRQILEYEGPVLFAASEDTSHQYGRTEVYYDESPSQEKEFIEYEDAGRGTRMLDHDPELESKIIEWLDEHL